MKQPVRLFSIGLITAGVIILIVFMLTRPATSKEMSTEDMIAELESKDFRVLTEDDYIALSVDDSNTHEDESDEALSEKQTEKDDSATKENNEDSEASEKNEASEDENEDDKEKAEETEATYTLNVKSGMSSRDISQVLKDNNIIDDMEAFNDYLQKNDYGQLIQLGESEVKASMSFHDLAEILASF